MKLSAFALILTLCVPVAACLLEDAATREPSIEQTTDDTAGNAERHRSNDDGSCQADQNTFGFDTVVAKKGIVDCNEKGNKPLCKECGNGGTFACCPPQPDWECDVLCDKWDYPDPKDKTKRSCL